MTTANIASQLLGVTAADNVTKGILGEAAWDVTIADATVTSSGEAGIWTDNRPGVGALDGTVFDPSHPRTTRFQVVNPNLYDNGKTVQVDLPGIAFTAVDHATVSGGKVYKTPAAAGARQVYGIGLIQYPGGPACSNVLLLDVDAGSGHQKPVAAMQLATMTEDTCTAGPCAAAQTGYYRLQGAGAPEGVICAPPGSDYVDIVAGCAYHKKSGVGSTGWVES